ncbi:iron-dicitrate transporter subunit FecD [Gallibacterium salpingitidis]|uniref:Iron-dicitrate transporter subunit FecD n=1 Tax=Gallibacterium salpingitidis TaxID=505341 RepID=A0A1A7Q6Q9_9PAST|nr:Fe(3+) dicitrate ABC transporter permease subunit FecD [Gallibacterium salpingitidis]OBW91876.1 iron-dicitrate transporter subunit FecD [Gallibacterium salpingitidis]OBX09796.1 iron-dicitrate transporter subunit FecD [Gallibacterium salpingitidis]OBX11321.1 iron-dicitrate transporter subunit FecD [Gallibacterium salpingitidis]WKS99242.1 Fe(3+) dicitrate ABC transporter permease subunit FecD [Gallibacterium salpingitidis]
MKLSVYYLILLLSIVTLLFMISLIFGTYTLSISDLISAFTNANSKDYFTLIEYRLPRALLAIVLGAALALSGTLVQAIIRNPLASPEILGINNAAGLAAVIILSFFPTLSIYWLPPITFIAGIAAFLLLWFLCSYRFSTLKMALIGVALSALYAAITHYIMLARPLEINLAMLWLTGSLWGRSWDFVYIALPWLLIFLPTSILLGKFLDLLGLGEEKANNLGVNVHRTQLITLLIAVALSATAVSVCGPIAFLGLVAPHMARKLFGGHHHILIPASILIGAILLQLADIIARTLAPPLELPAGILTAIIGAPYFFLLLIRKNK